MRLLLAAVVLVVRRLGFDGRLSQKCRHGTCVINIGPPPGRDVAATCSTAVQRQGPDWLVTFTEVWDGRAFHGMGCAHDGPLMHAWQFTVDDDGRIVQQVHFGDFAPQFVM